MADATGEASTAHFKTIYEKEFFNNGRESYRFHITEVNGKPKVNLSKYWFKFNEQKWLPTKQNFYFNFDAWSTFVANSSRLDKEIKKLGLSGLLLPITLYLGSCFLLLSCSFMEIKAI